MVFDDAEVHLAVADHREQGLGRNLGKLAEVLESKILQIELLLIDGRRRQDGCLDALVEPLRCDVAGVAYLLGNFLAQKRVFLGTRWHTCAKSCAKKGQNQAK